MNSRDSIIRYGDGYLPNYRIKQDGNWQGAIAEAVALFNNGNDHWCGALWSDIPNGCRHCYKCLMCCNYTDEDDTGMTAEDKIILFAKYIVGLGFKVTRPGYEWVNGKNMQHEHAQRMEA